MAIVKKYFYLSDYKNDQSLMWRSFILFCVKNLKHKRIYAHNFSSYDSQILIKNLLKLKFDKAKINIQPLYNSSGTLISLKIKYNNITLNFYDSLLILPSSLAKLAITFGL